jgi:hypothetical protein
MPNVGAFGILDVIFCYISNCVIGVAPVRSYGLQLHCGGICAESCQVGLIFDRICPLIDSYRLQSSEF